jgi:hypothetical protein
MTATVVVKRTLSKALNQDLELEAANIAAGIPSGIQQVSVGTLWARRYPPPHQETTDEQCAEPVGSQATSGVIAPMGGRQKMMTGAGCYTKDLQETHRN